MAKNIYKYKARDEEGRLIKGQQEAVSRESLAIELKSKGYYPVAIKDAKKEVDVKGIKPFTKISVKDLAIFCRQFSTILNAGIPLMDTLEILIRQTGNKKLKRAINIVEASINKGISLSESMANAGKTFPSTMINLIEAGEISGNLDIIFERLAIHFEKEYELNQKIRTAMTYPIIVSIVAISVVTFMILFVLPTFASLFEGMGAALPLPTRILLNAVEFIKVNGLYLLIFLTVLMFLMARLCKAQWGITLIDKIKLMLPVFGQLNRKISISRFNRTLSTMVGAGIPLIISLEASKKAVDNVIISSGIEYVKNQVVRGRGLSKPLEESGQFPPLVTQMISVGEETGALDNMLEKVADYYDGEVKYTVDRLSTLIEPILIVALGVLVGIIVVAMVLPMFEIMNIVG